MNTITSLKSFLADTYTLMLKTHNYHWNVTGPNFLEIHGMFEEQYENLFSASDRIAERIRALGEYAPGGLKAYAALTFIEEPKEGLSSDEMILDLLGDHRKLVVQAKQSIKVAIQYEDEATANMLTERIEYHEKKIWMLHSFFREKNVQK